MDTTATIVGILSDALEVPVGTDIPMQRPSRAVMVAQDGDQSDMFLMRPIYTLTCWGASDVDARGIAISAMHALSEAAETHPYLSAVLMESLARDEWGASGQSRYALSVQTIFNIE